jgi:predicted ATPase/class 3 adenylate cyclase
VSTRTFVFTDIEGSTRLLQSLGSDYARVLREHDAIVTEATRASGGDVFGSEGDAQFLVFDDAEAAVRAAARAQRALADHAWPPDHPVRVRMGIHTGEVERDGSGYVGLTLHETARVSAAAHGGQVLVSPATAALVGERLPDGIGLTELGTFTLKDIERPWSLRQLTIDGLEGSFPPLRARALAQTVLPRPLTSFVERDELAAIVALSERTRLLTLTGPGGTGKTRLAIAVAEQIADRFRDGTWFVALDAVTDSNLVVPAIVTALSVTTSSDAPIEQLIGYLRERSVLLVLDNLEQVVQVGPTLGRLVAECAGVSLLVTSRIPLHVYGEQEFPVPALTTPGRLAGADVGVLMDVASVRLFVERARAVKPAFSLTAENAADVSDVVERLDGLPLAIELAAARIKLLTPAALRERLDDRLGMLTGGSSDLPERQQTLRAAIAWSHDLLDERERRLFARFGAFAGAPALVRVEAVAGPGLGGDVLEGAASLVEQSLLRVENDDEPRFGMLATIRAFAREQLDASDDGEAVRRRHAEVYVGLAEEAAPDLLGPDGSTWNDRLESEHDDLRAALDWIVAHDEAELGLRAIAALWRFWQVRGHLYEADERVAAVLAMPSVASAPPALQARARIAAGGVAYWRFQTQAFNRHYMAALELARRTDDRALLAEALYNAGFAVTDREDATFAERMHEGRPYIEEALSLYRELGDMGGTARTSWALAVGAAGSDDIEAARTLLAESLEAARSAGDAYQVGWTLHTLGQSDVAVGDLDAAAGHIRGSLDMWVAAGDMSGITILLIDAAIVARRRGQEADSWRLIGAEASLRERIGTGVGQSVAEFAGIEPRREPETDEERRWLAEGRALSTESAIELARSGVLG